MPDLYHEGRVALEQLEAGVRGDSQRDQFAPVSLRVTSNLGYPDTLLRLELAQRDRLAHDSLLLTFR